MTRLETAGADAGSSGGPIVRLLVGIPVTVLLAFLCLVSISWTGWGFETDPVAQLLRDTPWLALAALTGAGAGAVHGWTVVGRRGWAVVTGAALGLLPAVVMVTAYFTDTY